MKPQDCTKHSNSHATRLGDYPFRLRLPLNPEGSPLSVTWNEPYLETCCRSALHRLCLAGTMGRPAGLRDDPCLERMERMGFVSRSPEGRFVATDEGRVRHTQEVLTSGKKLAPQS